MVLFFMAKFDLLFLDSLMLLKLILNKIMLLNI